MMSNASVNFRCAKTGNVFTLELARAAGDRTYRPIRIVRRIEAPGGNRAAGGAAISLEAIENRVWERMRCPWCGYRDSETGLFWVRCGGCKDYVCGGRISIRNGAPYFRCHADCGSEGDIRDSLDSMDAEFRAPKAIAAGAQTRMLRGGLASSAKFLTAGKQARQIR